jgi:hypothetical protein
VIDVVAALTDSVNPRDYWFKMKIRVKNEDGIELSTVCRQLKLEAPDGKMRETDCANTEGMFRIFYRGKRMVNVLPWPGTLVTPTVPRWASAACLTIARPRPVPPSARLRAWSTR